MDPWGTPYTGRGSDQLSLTRTRITLLERNVARNLCTGSLPRKDGEAVLEAEPIKSLCIIDGRDHGGGPGILQAGENLISHIHQQMTHPISLHAIILLFLQCTSVDSQFRTKLSYILDGTIVQGMFLRLPTLSGLQHFGMTVTNSCFQMSGHT